MRRSPALGRATRTAVLALLGTLSASPALHGEGVPAMNQPASADVPFRTIEKGSQSNIEAARQIVVRSAGEWAAFWKTHNFDKPAPPVDFDKEIVLGVFMGSRPTGGYTIAITSVRRADGSIVVGYRESSPRPGLMTTQVLTFPYHLVAIAKHSGDVRFEKQP